MAQGCGRGQDRGVEQHDRSCGREARPQAVRSPGGIQMVRGRTARVDRSVSGAKKAPGASFLCRDGSAWTTDKDGLIAALLSAEITARVGTRSRRNLCRAGARIRRFVVRAHRRAGQRRAARRARQTVAAGYHRHATGGRKNPEHSDHRAGRRQSHRRHQGDRRKRLVRRAAIRHRRCLQDLRREFPRPEHLKKIQEEAQAMVGAVLGAAARRRFSSTPCLKLPIVIQQIADSFQADIGRRILLENLRIVRIMSLPHEHRRDARFPKSS